MLEDFALLAVQIPLFDYMSRTTMTTAIGCPACLQVCMATLVKKSNNFASL